MKNLRAAVAAIIMSGAIALPALAESEPTALYYEQGESGTHDNISGKVEWSQVHGIYVVHLTSGSLYSGTAGYSLVLVKSLAKSFEAMPKCTRLQFRLEFVEQMHKHVRPTIRVGYAYEPIKYQTHVEYLDLNWDQYKEMKDPEGTKDWYVINLAKLLEEKTKEKKTECRLAWVAIGGRELYQKGLGNNGIMDIKVAGLNMSQDTKDGILAVPIKVHTDVAGDNLEKWSKDLNGTM